MKRKVAEDPVWGEVVSARSFPEMLGKYREIEELDAGHANRAVTAPAGFGCSPWKFPTVTSRETSVREQGAR